MVSLDGETTLGKELRRCVGGRLVGRLQRVRVRVRRVHDGEEDRAEELVEQDDEFVAYRYPSADQNLAILH